MRAQAAVLTALPNLEESDDKKRPLVWLIIALLTLLAHFAFFKIVPLISTPGAPPRVEISQIDPQKLESIRKAWEKEKAQTLLLNKNPSLPKDAEKPKDARYASDRNRVVEKEQLARDTDTLQSKSTRKATRKESKAASQKLKSLSKFGIPLHLDSKPRPETLADGTPESKDSRGADQAILDKKLPQGSENLLNTEESIFYSFYARVADVVIPSWRSLIRNAPLQKLPQPGDYTTEVDVVLDSQGNLVGVTHLADSGIREFDEIATTVFKKTPKFPNPPQALVKPDGFVHMGWTLTVQMGSGSGLNYLPPERIY